ncbi:hypothetical protein TcYC6_0005760 [Trypanosoma cruzi]|nr:hypothetical protein TcYC6_0005760 [Trypanosoma cruzi]
MVGDCCLVHLLCGRRLAVGSSSESRPPWKAASFQPGFIRRCAVYLDMLFVMCTSAGHVLPERWAARELGGKQGLVIAERQILGSDYAKAVANVQTRSALIYFQKEEALNYRSARETNIAVVGGLFAEGGDAVSTRGAHLSERAARWPPRMHGDDEIHSQINRIV